LPARPADMTRGDLEPAVRLEDFTIRYGSFTAVDGAAFTMPRGACGLLGKNGAGKSSILKAVLGLIRPSRGRARVLGMDALGEGRRLRDRIGYMAEKETIFPGLSGLEAVILAGRLSGLPPLEARQRAHEVLFLVRIEEERYRKVETYSAGMKQKIKLAQALVHDPELLFLDEPTNGLDPGGRSEILDLLKDLVRKKGKSLILSSHILPDVEKLCAHVVLIDGGKVLREGSIAEMTGAAGRLYRLRLRGGSEVEPALAAEGWLREDLGNGEYRVFLPPEVPAERLFELALANGAQVRLLELERKSLADVFLDAVRGAEVSKERRA